MYTANINNLQNNFYNSLPKTYDYLRPNAFRFGVKDIPNVSFTCQSANIPDIQLGYAVQPTPFVDIPTIGDKINFGDSCLLLLTRFCVYKLLFGSDEPVAFCRPVNPYPSP